MRPDYCAKIKADLAPKAKQLLALVEYDQNEMQGPPFSVSKQYVIDHYGDRFSIEQVHNEQIADLPDRYRQRGLTAMRDTAYILGPKT